MNEYPLRRVPVREQLPLLAEIPDAPEHIYVRGNLPSPGTKTLAVVGSRDYTDYGKRVTEFLIEGLRGYPISIVSGLALGIDAIAHAAALHASLHTICVPGSGIDDSVIYPRRNRGLARSILESGGCLISEFEPTFQATEWSFPKRNRIMAGLAHATLLIEAGERSGTLITARLTSEYNRDLFVVPGNIFSDNSKGVHQFLKLGATPVASPADILEALGMDAVPRIANNLVLTAPEEQILALLSEPLDHDSIIRQLPMEREKVLTLLMKMELDGLTRESNGLIYKIR